MSKTLKHSPDVLLSYVLWFVENAPPAKHRKALRIIYAHMIGAPRLLNPSRFKVWRLRNL